MIMKQRVSENSSRLIKGWGCWQMNDWTLMIALLLLGCLSEFLTSKYSKTRKIRVYLSVLVWLVIAAIFLILWLVR